MRVNYSMKKKTNSTRTLSNNEVINNKTQKVIPLFAEQLIITKKKGKNRRNRNQKK